MARPPGANTQGERLVKMLETLSDAGHVGITYRGLASFYRVSGRTARRDCDALERLGYVKRRRMNDAGEILVTPAFSLIWHKRDGQ